MQLVSESESILVPEPDARIMFLGYSPIRRSRSIGGSLRGLIARSFGPLGIPRIRRPMSGLLALLNLEEDIAEATAKGENLAWQPDRCSIW